MSYGKELIIDLYDCDISKFNRKDLKKFFWEMCEEIGMEACKLTFWDDKWTWLWKLIYFWDKTIQYQTDAHTTGTSAVQFIITSNITIHTLDKLGECYINIFSCKAFNPEKALWFARRYFKCDNADSYFIDRGKDSRCETLMQ